MCFGAKNLLYTLNLTPANKTTAAHFSDPQLPAPKQEFHLTKNTLKSGHLQPEKSFTTARNATFHFQFKQGRLVLALICSPPAHSSCAASSAPCHPSPSCLPGDPACSAGWPSCHCRVPFDSDAQSTGTAGL